MKNFFRPKFKGSKPEHVAEKEPQKKKGFVRKTGAFLDWTILPIREVGSLGRNIKVLYWTIRNILRSVYLMLKMSYRDFKSSVDESNNARVIDWLRSSMGHLYNKQQFFNQLSQDDMAFIKNVDRKFLFRRRVSIWFCVIAILIAIVSLYFSLGSGIGLLRAIFTTLLIFTFGFYTWYQSCILENIIYSKRRMTEYE